MSVQGLAPGQYWLIADYLGTYLARECFEVKERPASSAKQALEFTWGVLATRVSRAAGNLQLSKPDRGGDRHQVDLPLVAIRLQLQNAVTKQIFEKELRCWRGL